MLAVVCPQPASGRPYLSLLPSPAGRLSPSVAARRRAASALLALVAFAVLLGVGSLAGAGRDAPAGVPRVAGDGAPSVLASVHVVQPGETLWSLARLAQPRGDVRPLVARLRAAHGAGPLVPGEHLRLAV